MNLSNEQTRTQEKEILSFLKLGKSITPYDAEQMFGCMRLASRIFNLRKMGFSIVSERRKFVNKYGHKGSVCMYSLKQVGQ
jgi:Helix-turn-helix domain